VTAPVGSFEWHLEQLGEHPCCWVMDGEPCGLWCGHAGDHLPWVPGDYLSLTPLLNPLGWLRLVLARWPWLPCPVCSDRTDGFPVPGVVGLHVWVFQPGGSVERSGRYWQFWPCGCEAFEVTR
jgi:hypothetical protein